MTTADTAPRRKTLLLPDGELSYLEWSGPSSEPALVFLHANGVHGGVYRRLLGPLEERVRILAVDLRGHGESRLPADPAGFPGWTIYRDDVIAFLDSLGLEQVFMAGHSLGAVTSTLVAVHQPDRVQGLVLADPVFLPRWAIALTRGLDLFGQGWRVGPAGPARRRRNGWADRAAARAHYHGRGMFRTWSEGWLDDYLAEGLRARDDGTVELACAPAWEARTFETMPRDIWRVVQGIRCPTTIVYGGDSNTFRRASARLAPKRIPGVRMVPVAGATHFVPMERPEVVREEIEAMVLAKTVGGP